MHTYRFGEFELDLAAQQLRREGEPLRLERRPFDLLVMLVLHAGELQTRDDIIDVLWPVKVVIDFDAGVNTLVRKVRHVLGDPAEAPRFIETVPGRGYRFIAPVTPVEPAPTPAAAPRQTPPTAPQSSSRRRLLLVSLVVVGVAAALLAWQQNLFSPGQNRIAVLPFVNLTGDAKLGYLASGLADDTSISLGRIDLPGLAVIGGVSARAFARSGLALPEIRRQFDIDYLVDGSLRGDKDRLRISVRLLRTRDGEQLWSANFDRVRTDALGLQQELSAAIAEQVRQTLSPDVAIVIARRQTQNPQAYDLYLKGREQWMQFLPTSVDDAVAYYEQAVALDPDYGLAWAGMAHALATSTVTIGATRDAVLPRARAALDRALATAPELAETQYALAAYRGFIDQDLAGSTAAAQRAVQLDPNLAMAWMTLGIMLSNQGRYNEAREAMRRARVLDPLFPLLFANSAHVASVAGDSQAAFNLARQAIAINPEFWVGYFQLGLAQLRVGDYEAALVSLTEAERLSGGHRSTVDKRGFALGKLGRRAEARAILNKLLASREREPQSPAAIAGLYAGLGETDRAFEWLERAVTVQDAELKGMPTDPMFYDLHGDPRFARILQAAGYPAPDD
jgi:TolB-like protein/DNA-binding winged helix-turn-helix (wHTH) protein/Flp pilus assembly protein TadD